MELIGQGRMAEVFALDDVTVVKVDRPGFDGAAAHEATIIREVSLGGAPVPSVIGTTMIDGRHALLLERLKGPSLAAVIHEAESVEPLAEAFVELQIALQATHVPSAPRLMTRLTKQVQRSGLPGATRSELIRYLEEAPVDVSLCHFDFHPENIIVTETGWKVIDWVDAAAGPIGADFARTIVLRADATDAPTVSFMNHVRHYSALRRDTGSDDMWLRVIAAARMSEGFTGRYASWLNSVVMHGL